MTDYRQELIPPQYRNLVVNPSGESVALGASFIASNGVIETGLTTAEGAPAAAAGASVLQYQVLDNTSLSYFFAPLGPDEPVHRGGFKIPIGRTVSARFRVRASSTVWLQPQASWMTEHWSDGTGTGLAAPMQIDVIGAPVSAGTTAWVDLTFSVAEEAIPQGATHWRPLVAVFSADPRTAPSPPALNTKVWVDQSVVTDSGAEISSVPYGDGDQNGWMWEGEPHFSTSRTIPAQAPLLQNWIYDPSSADGSISPWAAYNSAAVAVSSVVEDGSRAFRIEKTQTDAATVGISTSAGVKNRPGGTQVTLSAKVKVPVGSVSHSIQFIARDTPNNDSSSLVDVTDGALITVVPADGVWTTVYVTGTVKQGRTLDSVYIVRTGSGTAGQVFFVKDVMLVDGQLTAFFDGDTADTSDYQYDWTGAPYASPSAKYSTASLLLDGEVLPTGDDPTADSTPEESLASVEADMTMRAFSPPQELAPEVPDASVDDNIMFRRQSTRPDVAEAEDVIGWKTSNRNLCLNEDVVVEGLTLNSMDDFGIVWLVSDIDGWWTMPEPDVPDVPRAWFDGSYETRGRFGARTFTLSGSFIPRSPRDVAAARDRLIRAVNLCHRGGWFMTTETAGGKKVVKGSKVWLAGQPLITTTGLNGKTDFSIALRAPDSLKHSIKDGKPPGYDSIKILTTSSNYPERKYPRKYPWKYPDAVFGTTAATIINEGNAMSWPIMRLAGPTNGALRVYNADTEQEFRVTKKLYAGEVLEIDCFTRQVTLNGSGNSRFYLDVDVDWLQLQPGANKIWFMEETVGTIRTKLEILWRSSWIG